MASEYACYSMGAILQASAILNLRRTPGLLFDDTYLRALKDRDQNTENHLVSYFSRPVQLKLQARLRSPELVQDARQETFLRVFSYFRMGKSLDNPASLPGFIHTVCHNVALELLRGHLRHDQMAENAPEPADSAPGPEDQMVTAERNRSCAGCSGNWPKKTVSCSAVSCWKKRTRTPFAGNSTLIGAICESCCIAPACGLRRPYYSRRRGGRRAAAER